MPANPALALQRRARDAAGNPDLIAALEAGAPLATALDLLGIDRDLVGALADRSEVRTAIARRAIQLQDQLSHEEKGKREAALIELERVHGWRKPNAQTVDEKFNDALDEFRTVDPEGHARLYAILAREGETAAQKRKRKRETQ
jgi:hypothetical protein